jgi:hypothetical protein
MPQLKPPGPQEITLADPSPVDDAKIAIFQGQVRNRTDQSGWFFGCTSPISVLISFDRLRTIQN